MNAPPRTRQGRLPGDRAAHGDRPPARAPRSDAASEAPRGEAAPEPAASLQQLLASLRELAVAAADRAIGFAADRVEQVTGVLERVAEDGGLGVGAVVGGARARLAGNSVVWGALKGALGALSPAARIGLIVALILALVLLPVTLVLALVALIVIAIVLAVRLRTA